MLLYGAVCFSVVAYVTLCSCLLLYSVVNCDSVSVTVVAVCYCPFVLLLFCADEIDPSSLRFPLK